MKSNTETLYVSMGQINVMALCLLLVVAMIDVRPVFARKTNLPHFPTRSHTSGLTDREVNILYGEFKELRSFGVIAASTVGDAGLIGLDETALTSFLKAKFKEYFGESFYDDVTRDSRKFLSLLSSKDKNIGNMTSRVWVIADDDLVIYHVKSDAGNFDNPSIWNEEVLGHGTKATSSAAIRRILDEMMKELATSFFRVRGRQM